MTTLTQTIDLHVFSDFACPWCYIGTERLDRLVADYPVNIHWHPYQIRDDLPEEGIPMAALFPAGELEQKMGFVEKAVAEAGLPFRAPERSPNTHLAHQAACFADKQGKGDAFHRALLSAYFVDGQDLGDVQVLVEAARSVGLDGDALAEALASGKYRNEVDWAINEARSMGIQSVPTYVFGTGAAFSGAHPYETFKQVLEAHVLPALEAGGGGCGGGGCGCGAGGCGGGGCGCR